MTKEQFLAQVEKHFGDVTMSGWHQRTAEWIWDNLLYEGNQSMKVKEYYEFETREERMARIEADYQAMMDRRASQRERTIEEQMVRTGCTREQAEEMLP